jgi:hypothetical protein
MTPQSQPLSRAYPTAASIDSQSHIIARFRRAVTKAGQAIITETVRIYFSIVSMPIRGPGSVQSFVIMIALCDKSANPLVVHIGGQSSHGFMSFVSQQLFKPKAFSDILTSD